MFGSFRKFLNSSLGFSYEERLIRNCDRVSVIASEIIDLKDRTISAAYNWKIWSISLPSDSPETSNRWFSDSYKKWKTDEQKT